MHRYGKILSTPRWFCSFALTCSVGGEGWWGGGICFIPLSSPGIWLYLLTIISNHSHTFSSQRLPFNLRYFMYNLFKRSRWSQMQFYSLTLPSLPLSHFLTSHSLHTVYLFSSNLWDSRLLSSVHPKAPVYYLDYTNYPKIVFTIIILSLYINHMLSISIFINLAHISWMNSFVMYMWCVGVHIEHIWTFTFKYLRQFIHSMFSFSLNAIFLLYSLPQVMVSSDTSITKPF